MLKNILIVLLILIYLTALFYALYMQISGLGIFSIAISVMFFTYILYAMNKPRERKELTNTKISNIPQLLGLGSPMVISLLPHLFSIIFNLLEKHHDKLETKQRNKLQDDVEQLVECISRYRAGPKNKKS